MTDVDGKKTDERDKSVAPSINGVVSLDGRRSSLSNPELYRDVGRCCMDGDDIRGVDTSPYGRDVTLDGEYIRSSSRSLDEPVQFAESRVFDRRYRLEGAPSDGGCAAANKAS